MTCPTCQDFGVLYSVPEGKDITCPDCPKIEFDVVDVLTGKIKKPEYTPSV